MPDSEVVSVKDAVPVSDEVGDTLGVPVIELVCVSVPLGERLRDGVRVCVAERVVVRDGDFVEVGPAVNVAVFVVLCEGVPVPDGVIEPVSDGVTRELPVDVSDGVGAVETVCVTDPVDVTLNVDAIDSV